MCTVTWAGTDTGYELFCNRDELRTRPRAEPTTLAEVDGVAYLAPTDPVAGGTWLAVNEWGVAVTLLNAYDLADKGRPSRQREPRSRGELVRALASSKSRAGSKLALERRDLTPYPPFTLAVFEPGRSGGAGPPLVLVLDWDGTALDERPPDTLPILSSSSYRSEAVIAARREALASIRVDRSAASERSLRFHRLHLEGGRTISPCMHRDHSVSVSLSWVRVDLESVEFRYAEGPPCAEHPFSIATLPRSVQTVGQPLALEG